jgi:hypothetical protein
MLAQCAVCYVCPLYREIALSFKWDIGTGVGSGPANFDCLGNRPASQHFPI